MRKNEPRTKNSCSSYKLWSSSFLISSSEGLKTATLPFMQLLFEVTSAFGTVGLSTGITPDLSALSKFIISLIMFIGRLGPMTIATIWSFKKPSDACYSEETVIIG